MSNKFSSVLQLTDLDDFITPSQECIKPIEIKNSKSGGVGKIKIHGDGTYFQESKEGQLKKLERVQVTLNDCLACSGCITSAESVLINQQNFNEIIKVLNKNKEDKENYGGKLVVVSLSIQSVVSLAQKYEMTPEQVAKCLATFFKQLGADKVIEMSIAEDLSLLEVQNEFIERYRNKTTTVNLLPMLASSCPGWICYAEKTHGNFILPFVSTVKSPQQIMGSLVKTNLGYSSDNIYHITLMPCYDKKLEASRNEFFNNELNARDVDCVITTVEVEQLLAEQNISLPEISATELDYPWGNYSDSVLYGHSGSGSGGYAHHILIHAAREIFGVELTELNWHTGKNPDLKEITVEGKDPNMVLRFAIANGFRNIQNVVQKMKRGKCHYDYVEIMACPSGCLNGGAQTKPNDGAPAREIVSQLECLYKNIPVSFPEQNNVVRKLYEEWLDGRGSDKCSSLLHTNYRPVEKLTTALNIKW
ncbi:UNVERIFIED_CONTAM: hypothetical protein PYX00_005190 [Menopon gallinae]|uniref:Iron hydrogenase small subunit domain-containing protein n=1 Tax=Menopon gallinae TaxID=328185 RepID=A0AAW2HRH8_9NEOP